MKNFILLFLGLSMFVGKAQAISVNETLKYRVHYGLLNAGFATLKVEETTVAGRPSYHIKGAGSTTGAVRLFFKLDDRYETFLDKETFKPSIFIRDINEGGHIKNKKLSFNHNYNTVTVEDYKEKRVTTYRVDKDVQDMLSAFYYLRSMSNASFTPGSSKVINIFMDEEVYPFKLKVLGREQVDSKFGKINCIKIRPYVQKGRVFKEKESVTVWVSDDDNLIPIRLQADLAVGSLKMDLHAYSNLNHPLTFR